MKHPMYSRQTYIKIGYLGENVYELIAIVGSALQRADVRAEIQAAWSQEVFAYRISPDISERIFEICEKYVDIEQPKYHH